MKFPVKVNHFVKEKKKNLLNNFLDSLPSLKIVNPYVPEEDEEEFYFVDLLENPHNPDKFIHTKSEEKFFTSSERQGLVHYILKSTW